MERWNVYLEEVAQSIKSVVCLSLVFISLKKNLTLGHLISLLRS